MIHQSLTCSCDLSYKTLKQQIISSKDFVWMAASQLQRKLWFTGHNGFKKIKQTSFLKTNCKPCSDASGRNGSVEVQRR